MAILGCIADDFTGASDAASFLVKGGMSVQLYNGIPESAADLKPVQAIVIALKSRTQETAQAVADSQKAAQFLSAQGITHLYFKYCSTFDSTPKGNIGPVCDALMKQMHAPYSLLCPSLPVNGRKVADGKLFVNGVPLDESPMKDHPLTPMWDCRIAELMRPQSKYSCQVLCRRDFSKFSDIQPQETERPYYLIPDYETDEDGEAIVRHFGHLSFLSGGSGLLKPLAEYLLSSSDHKDTASIPDTSVPGKALLIAGSCSKMTLAQIAWYQAQNLPSYRLDPPSLLNGSQTLDDVWDYVEKHTSEHQAVLVYSSDTPEMVRKYQELGTERIAALLEQTSSDLARRAVDHGYTRIISAGGETSGAVTKGLHFSSYQIGESIAPGVPVMVPATRPDIRLVLKSGNFGQEDFFGRALSMTRKKA